MHMQMRARTVAWCLALAGGWSLPAQVATSSAVAEARATEPPSGSVVVRSVTDPATGDQWLLLRDPQHPEAPGRYLLASSLNARQPGRPRSTELEAPMRMDARRAIRSGDRILVEESTPVLETSLEGVALQSAKAGDALTVRLKVNGRIVRAIALGPGHAALAVVQGGNR